MQAGACCWLGALRGRVAVGRLAAPQSAVSTKTGHGVTHSGNEGEGLFRGRTRGSLMLSPPGDRAEVCGLESAVGPRRGTAGPPRHRSRATGQALKAARPEVGGPIPPRAPMRPPARCCSSRLLAGGGGGSAVLLAGWLRDDPALRSPRGWKNVLCLGTTPPPVSLALPKASPPGLSLGPDLSPSPRPSGDQQARHRTLGLSQRWVPTPASSTCRCWEPSCRAEAQS